MAAAAAPTAAPAPGGNAAPAASFAAAGAGLPAARQGSQRSEPPLFAGEPTFRLGPVDVHAPTLVRRFRVRQRFDLSDRLAASAGLAWDFGSSSLGPTASLIYKLDPDNPKSKSRLELTDSRVLARKGWEVRIKGATVGVSLEASLPFRGDDGKLLWGGGAGAGAAGGQPALRPDVHLSLDHVKPLKYELIGIGLVLLLNMPLKLSNKEAELGLPWGLGRLRGYGRASLRRAGYTAWKLGASETSAVLDL